MAVTDNDRRAYLEANVSTDLQFAWSDSSVSLAAQYTLAQHYKTLRVFSSMADSKADLRTALRTDFAMDQNASAEMRADVAKIVASWELARELSKKEQELRAEAKVLGMPRTIQHSERQAMVKAVEQIIGKLQESETPSNEYLATKVEECENNEPIALPLDEVTSKYDTTTSSLQSSLDAGGHLRVVKTKAKGKMPDNTESLRKVLKLEGIAWLCMAAKFRTKPWLHGLTLNDWLNKNGASFSVTSKANHFRVLTSNPANTTRLSSHLASVLNRSPDITTGLLQENMYLCLVNCCSKYMHVNLTNFGAVATTPLSSAADHE